MRTLYLLRGAPASGKSTWIRDNHLEQYVISADSIRLMVQSPVLNNEGRTIITQKNDNKVWSLLMNMLENRMSRGEFCIIDATHYKLELIQKYKSLISKYRYRAYIVDFTDIPLEELKKRNNERDSYKYVPEEVIEKMYAVFKSDNLVKQVPSYTKILTRDEAIIKLKEDPIYDFNEYKKIIVIPDLHGCYEPLKQYFVENPFRDDYFYCFLGDYTDRGKQNKEVLEFLISIMNNTNVLLLEGNHEKWIRKYCSKEEKITLSKGDIDLLSKFVSKSDLAEIRLKNKTSYEFEHNTIPQIESVDKSLLRRLCEKLAQFAYFKFNDKVYCLTHGGISNKPTIFTSTEEFIKGVGEYSENEEIYKSWTKNTPDNYIQIHGHRNVYNIEPFYDNKNINLNTAVEYGEKLRIAEITKEGVDILYFDNPVFVERIDNNENMNIETNNFDDLYKVLNNCRVINKKELDNNIISYNFNRDAFKKGIWNNITTRARGLFINKITQNVTCRSYDKFFNIEEVYETEMRNLKSNIKFPLIGYKKENGFLGLVSWDKDNNELFIASKSTNKSEHCLMIKRLFDQLEYKDDIIEFLKNNNVTLIFEVIDVINDPHIIKYNESKLFLLDIIYNQLDSFKRYSFDELTSLSSKWKVETKTKDIIFNDWNDFLKFYNKVKNDKTIHHEGWVFEDQNNFMFKYKTPYYKFWKYMRSIKDMIIKDKKPIKQTFTDKYEVEIINYMRNLDVEKLKEMSIIDVRDNFLKDTYFSGDCWDPQEGDN